MSALPSHHVPPWQWDVFCRVIDNFGDIGVCWRLASQLAAAGQRVRLWVDDASALAWMAPGGATGIEVRSWGAFPAANEPSSDVLVEAFGCEIAPDFIAACADRVSAGAQKPVWINLEYLSAESWVPRHHGLPSPVLHGPAAGWTKWFYYPGFGKNTGGLLRERSLMDRMQAFDRGAWRRQQGSSALGFAVLLRTASAGRLAAAMREWSNSAHLPAGHARPCAARRASGDARNFK